MRVGFEIIERKEYDEEEDGVEGVEYKIKLTLPEGTIKFKVVCYVDGEFLIEPA